MKNNMKIMKNEIIIINNSVACRKAINIKWNDNEKKKIVSKCK